MCTPLGVCGGMAANGTISNLHVIGSLHSDHLQLMQ
jgi:hypothetical protein